MWLELEVLFRLMVSAFLSSLIGFERQATGKRAGLRTHMLVAVGSTLFVSFAELYIDASTVKHMAPSGLPEGLRIEIQPITLVQAIATGIGFLGAGTIFVAGHQRRVHGLTTAASIWATAAMGVTIGIGRYVLAVGTTFLILFILHIMIRLEASHNADETAMTGVDVPPSAGGD